MIFSQVGALALATPLALRLGGSRRLLDLIGDALGWFVPFFMLGFVLLGAMWAVGRVAGQPAGGLQLQHVGRWMLLVMGPYFGVIFFSDNDLVMTVLSYVPFSSAVAMPVRLFAGEARRGNRSLSMLECWRWRRWSTVLVASRLYAGSLLQTGGRVRLSRAWSGCGVAGVSAA